MINIVERIVRNALVVLVIILYPNIANAQREIERLDRGVVALKIDNGVFVSWRVFGTELYNVKYNLYRDSEKINATPITGASNYIDTAGTLSSNYSIAAVIDGKEQAISKPIKVWEKNYLDIPLQIPSGFTTPDGYTCSYSANDCSVGDLDGDGQYEIVVKWDPNNSRDNSQDGYTGKVYLDAYEMDGTQLWRIDLGVNIRAGAHYTQFMVYDLDGDGKAEIACKTADGGVDGTGRNIGTVGADYRSIYGRILSGPEYLTLFEGQTGKALVTTDYDPPRGSVSSWGDSYGNRVDRFLACVAYLDSIHPSLVMCRGYYTRTVLVAWDWRNGTLTKRWVFDSNIGYSTYAGQGNHNLSVADVDDDGKDEIMYGACAIDHDGTGLWTTGLGHGDAMHVSDIDPSRPGLEKWGITEPANTSGSQLLDARTGEIIWGTDPADVARGVSADVTAAYPGMECWGGTTGLMSAKGQYVGNSPSSANHLIWWDGDLLRELLDGVTVGKYGYSNIFTATGCSSNNSTKANPCLTVDIIGDWREEAIWRTTDSKYLRIYTTTYSTNHRIYTLMHDPQYRLSIAWQNAAYNQPPHTGFFLGEGMDTLPDPPISYPATSPCKGILQLSWQNLDIGNPLRGCATESEGVFQIAGSGNDIWGSDDECHYVYQMLKGDGEIIARVTEIDNTDTLAKAGVMIRESLDSDAKYSLISLTPGYGVCSQFRINTGGSTSLLNKAGLKAPYWIKIVRIGNTFISYHSSDGSAWTKHIQISINMPEVVYIGMVVTSRNKHELCDAEMDNVSVSGISVGSILHECWKDIPGAKITDLTSDVNYPYEPTFSTLLRNLELPDANWEDNYGTRLRGYLHPIDSGNYTFWIAGNDSCELWLSTDTSAGSASLIAEVPGWTDPREWNKYNHQQSDTFTLDAGQSYYIEVLHKEGNEDDHLAVAWSGPGISQKIIGGAYLSPYYIPIITGDEDIHKKVVNPAMCKVYPNPAHDKITIEISEGFNETSLLLLFNSMGRIVYSVNINGNANTLDLNGIIPGIYILKVYNDSQSYTTKILVIPSYN